ncbi:MAG: long-chain fatty acid--CoA ligase [Bacteroidales bacterium]|nr:long-chain fatty acid--CoA ligase [Bacteroidales bacterium]
MARNKITHFFTYFQNSAAQYWDREVLTNIDGISYTYGQICDNIERIHILLEAAGIGKGDKVAICAKNSAQWCVAFLASTAYEAVTVPLLHDFHPESIATLVDHSESKLLFTTTDIWQNLDLERMPLLQVAVNVEDYTILYNTIGAGLEDCFANLETLFSTKFPNFSIKDVHYPTNNLDDLALINYTSGTTSDPKGVMLTYGNISSNITYAADTIPNTADDKIVSMLPLAHMYGMAFEFLYQVAGGCHVYFLGKVPSPKVLLNAFAVIQPYLIVTVPLVIEKIFRNVVFPTIEKPLIKSLMKVPFFSRLIKNRIRSKILDAFGGKIQHIIIGGAAINKEVEDCMKDIRLPYTVGYGMTECAPILAYEDWRKFAKGSCGKAVDRMEIRIDSEDPEHVVGEIQVRGANVMLGYYKNPEATAAAFTEDGWMRTGDLGLIDNKGNVFINGRSKNMILSANGQNIYPEEIEDRLNNQPYVVESVVIERDKRIVALVYPDYDRVSQESMDENDLAKLMEENRVKLNLMLPLYSRIARIELRKNEFEKTPKRSIKRFLYK